MRVRVEVSGLEDVQRSIERVGDRASEVARDVLDRIANQIVAAAKPLTPDDPETGGSRLRDSVRRLKARITKARDGSKRAEVTVLAGGAPLMKYLGKRKYAAWALVQHEDLTLHHTSGQAKFIEIPVNRFAPTVPGALEAAIGSEVQRAV